MPSARRQTDDGRGDRGRPLRLVRRKNLQRSGQEVMVLEQASEIGGRVQTMDIDGYRVDKGFQVLLTAYQEAAEVWPSMRWISFHCRGCRHPRP